MLLDIFKNKNCFKLVCGAGNEDVDEVEKLVALYSVAGCNFFDLCAKEEVVMAAKKGLERAGIKENRYLCVSVGDENDQHFCKANINTETCVSCGECKKVCLQDAVLLEKSAYKINKIKCIGCKKCINICPQNAINLEKKSVDLEKVLPPLINLGIDCIEFHVVGNEGAEIYENWDKINSLFSGPLSISINRNVLGDTQLVDTVKKLVDVRKPYTTIIQADGVPMSGGKDSYKSTLQAVAIADMFEGANLDAFIMVSGGTNSKTSNLAKLCEVGIDGVAIGSFARKIVKEYTQRDDFFENEEIFNKALLIVKNLVYETLKYLG